MAHREKQFALDGFLDVAAQTRAKLQKLANEMLIASKEHGIGFDEVREAAETRGWLTGKEPDRSLSFGSAIMKKAGGVVVRHRKSRHPNAHGRLVAVYVHKQYSPLPYDHG